MRLAVAAATLSSVVGLASAQFAASSGDTADSYCNSGGKFCVTAVYIPSQQTTNYTLVVDNNAAYGWTGIGVGSDMPGANIVINWINPDNSITMSQRGTTAEVQPLETRVTAPAFSRNTDSRIVGSQVVYSWLFPTTTAPGGTVGHIYAYAGSDRQPASSASDATVRKHDQRGNFDLDFSKAYDGSAPAGLLGATNSATGGSTPSAAGESEQQGSASRDLSNLTTQLYIVHMVFMCVGWLLLAPLGILIARYGRQAFRWFPSHAGIQALTVIFIAIGFATGVSALKRQGRSEWSRLHHKLGLALFILVCLQAVAGALTHEIRKRTGNRLIGYFHWANGVVMFGLAVWNCHEGLELWDWQPPMYASYIIYAWAGVVFLLYASGLALIPRQRRKANENAEFEKTSDRSAY